MEKLAKFCTLFVSHFSIQKIDQKELMRPSLILLGIDIFLCEQNAKSILFTYLFFLCRCSKILHKHIFGLRQKKVKQRTDFKSLSWQVVSRKPYVINRGGQLISLFHLTRVGTWSKKGQKHPYVIKEWPLIVFWVSHQGPPYVLE